MKENLKLRLRNLIKILKTNSYILLVLLFFTFSIDYSLSYFNSNINGHSSVRVGQMENWTYPLLYVKKGNIWYPTSERIINGDFENEGGFELINGQVASQSAMLGNYFLPLSGMKMVVLGQMLSAPEDSSITWIIEDEASDFIVNVNFLSSYTPIISNATVKLSVNSELKDFYTVSEVFGNSVINNSTSSGYLGLHADLSAVTYPAVIKLDFIPDTNNLLQSELLLVDKASTNVVYANSSTPFEIRFRDNTGQTFVTDNDTTSSYASEFFLPDGNRIIQYYVKNEMNTFTDPIPIMVRIKTRNMENIEDSIIRKREQYLADLSFSFETHIAPIYYLLNSFQFCGDNISSISGVFKKITLIQKVKVHLDSCTTIQTHDEYGNSSQISEVFNYLNQ